MNIKYVKSSKIYQNLCNRNLLRHLLRTSHLVLQVPDAVAVSKLIMCRATLWQNATLKATHVEEQVGIVLAVDRHKAVLP